MTERDTSGGGTGIDSFDALLQEAARVSEPSAPRGRRLLPAGTTLCGGRLSMLQRIGEGGMGVVYEVFDSERNTRVALKTLNRLDAAGVYRLKNEFRALAHVTHVNLCRLHELFAEGDAWFFTMELIEGERFDHWVRPEGALREERLRQALPQLVLAVGAIHAAGKLHRDLKPSNVLVTPDGRVVVLDFGLAVDPEVGGVGHTVADESLSGTPAYMAPEQAAGAPATAASDYYAFGVMLFEALTGTLPFSGNAHEMLVDKQRSDPPSVSGTWPRAPADLASLCDALLAREPAARPDGKKTLERARGPSDVRPAPLGTSAPTPERELLVGRETELAALCAAYEAAAAGQPVVLFVAGESGMGKSALVAHFLDELRAQGRAAVLAGRCYERESVPFKGIDSVVDDLSRFLRKLSASEASALMPREAYALTRIFPVLGRVDAVAQAPKKDIVDPQELRQRAFVAFGELLARIRDRRPLVVHIDDAQWLERDAVTFLGYLLEQHEPTPTLFVFTHRSEGATENPLLTELYRHVRENARLQRRDVAVGALSAESARDLAARLLGAGDRTRAEAVASESGGSPFFVGELSLQTSTSVDGARVTLHEALQAHLQRLGMSARRLLEVLAIGGRPFTLDVALDASGASHEHVDLLRAERLLRGSGQDRGVECYHDKIRESVVQALPPERARAVHAALLAALVEQPAPDPEHLAVHAEGAGDRAAAARYAEQAGEVASRAMAFERAAQLYGRALALGNYDGDARRELLIKLGDATASAGRGADAARIYLDTAKGAAEDRTFELNRRAAEQLLMCGRIDDGKALFGDVLRAIGLALPRGPKAALRSLAWERARLKLRGLRFHTRKDELSDLERRKLLALRAGRAFAAVDVLVGAALNARYLRLALDSGVPDHAATALLLEAWFASLEGGAPAQSRAQVLLNQAEVLALASGQPGTLATLQLARSFVARNFGDAKASKAHADEALKIIRERCRAQVFELGSVHHARQGACNLLGDFAPPAELAGLIDDGWRRGNLYTAVMLTGSCAMARLIQGDADGVQRHLMRAMQHWPTPRVYSYPDFHLLEASVLHAIYVGEPARALESVRTDWAATKKAMLHRRPDRLGHLLALRGGCAVAAARLAHGSAAELRALARADARALSRIRRPLASALGQRLRAALAFDEGHHDDAVTHLRGALKTFEAIGIKPATAAVRRRLGQRVGGNEGAALVAQADAELGAMGAVDLEAATRLLEIA